MTPHGIYRQSACTVAATDRCFLWHVQTRKDAGMEIGVTREYTGAATIDKLDTVLSFIGESLTQADCSEEDRALIYIAAEEIYVNIAHYAYGEGTGPVVVRTRLVGNPLRVIVEFEDGGAPYNPLDKEDPDITLSAEERSVGGLGIFMVKEMMDTVRYEYTKGKNLFAMEKRISLDNVTPDAG